MKKKFKLKGYYSCLFLLVGVISAVNAQITITDVFPTRITKGSIITVQGSGFTEENVTLEQMFSDGTTGFIIDFSINTDRNNPRSLEIINRKWLSDTEMTFEVGYEKAQEVDIVDVRNGSVNGKSVENEDFSAELLVEGVEYPVGGAKVELYYIAPTKRLHAVGSSPDVSPKGNVTKIEEIYTDYQEAPNQSFWRSGSGPGPNGSPNTDRPNEPDDDHNLLGFKYNNIIYSTGVDDVKLQTNLQTDLNEDSSLSISNQIFNAYSTNGITAKTVRKHHIFTGDKMDGKEGENGNFFKNIDAIKNLSMFDVLIDGENGLNLATGVNNINENITINFFSGNGQVGAASDGVPDLLITNMAEAGKTDVYAYVDDIGNVIGRPIKVTIDNNNTDNPGLSEWDTDQYRVTPDVNFSQARPTERIYSKNQRRPIRMLAFQLDEFGINNNSKDVDPEWSIESISNITAAAGGSADHAFLAYNGNAFVIKSPKVLKRPLSRAICRFSDDENIDIVFEAEVGINGTPADPNDPDYAAEQVKEALSYQWFKYGTVLPGEDSKKLTLTNISEDDLGLYRLIVSNAYGRIIIPANLTQGGVPTLWNDTTNTWELPMGFVSDDGDDGTTPTNAIEVKDRDRLLIFSGSYENKPGFTVPNVTEGCDCIVSAGATVEIPSGKTLKLYDFIDVREGFTLTDTDENGNDVVVEEVLDGKIIFKDGASLVQTKPVPFEENNNSGVIQYNRSAVENISEDDYVYWSSPVADFAIDGIHGDTNSTFAYYWDPTVVNANTTVGNWKVPEEGTMTNTKGYIAQVGSGQASVTTIFKGLPHNGEVKTPEKLIKTPSPNTNEPSDKDWNLIGNPYPSSISVEKFLVFNADKNTPPSNKNGKVIDGFVYLWTHQNPAAEENTDFYDNIGYKFPNDYIKVNASGLSEPWPTEGIQDGDFDGNIRAGQAFFVKALKKERVIFNNAMRFEGENTFGNTEFFRSANQNTNNDGAVSNEKIWLSLVNDNAIATSTLIAYVRGATLEKDIIYDATEDGKSFSIYSMIDQNPMVIQGRPLPFNDTDSVPIGITLDNDGIYTLAIDQLEGDRFVDQEQAIFIEDVYLNTIHDLRQAPYTFAGTSGVLSDRFVLRYTNDASLSINDSTNKTTFAFVNNGILQVNASQNIEHITLFDITGKTIIKYNVNNNSHFSSDFNFSEGVYLATISLKNGAVVTKKIMN